MNITRKYVFDWSEGTIKWQFPHQNSQKVTILAVGDVYFSPDAERMILERGWDFIFRPTKHIFQSADVVIGNLETPLSERGDPILKCGPNLRASPSLAKMLAEAGFTVLGVANNHIRDYGSIGLLDTLHHLRAQEIFAVGSGVDQASAQKPIVLEVHGISLGIFAFAYQQESIAKKNRPGAANLEQSEYLEAVETYSNQVDGLFVFLHMGFEFSNYPVPPYIKLARRFIDSGAICVIGHHPHVPQGLEIYKGKVIAYSLGNFIAPWKGMLAYSPYANLGYLLKIQLCEKGTSIAEIIPYKVSHFYQPVPLSGRERAVVLKHLERISEDLQDINLIQLEWEKTASKEIRLFLLYCLLGRNNPLQLRLWSCLRSILRPQLRYCYKTWLESFPRRIRNRIQEFSKCINPKLDTKKATFGLKESQ